MGLSAFTPLFAAMRSPLRAASLCALLLSGCAADGGAALGEGATSATHDDTDASTAPDAPDAPDPTDRDDAPSSNTPTDTSPDTTPDTPPKPQTCAGPPQRAVISRLTFTRELSAGVCEGLNLDHTITHPGDQTGCRKADFTSPDGLEGVDNQFVTLLPAFELVGGEEGIDSAIQTAIREGSVLIVIELSGLDDAQDDACVAAQFSRATGRPSLGADGQLEPSQTLDRFPDDAPIPVPDAAVIDGALTLGPVNFTLPMHISGYDILLTVHDTMLRFAIADDGSLHGLLAGSVSLEELFTVLDQIEDGTALLVTIRRVLSGAADLSPDDTGRCQRMSIALHFDATPIFYFDP
jgi:hypothetical protein